MSRQKELMQDFENLTDVEIFSMIAETDEALARKGQEAFYLRYSGHIYNSCRRLCGSAVESEEDAMDLMHDVVILVFQNAKQYKSDVDPASEEANWKTKAWLNRIALNLYLDAKSELNKLDLDQLAIEYRELFSLMETSKDEQPIKRSRLLEYAKQCLQELDRKKVELLCSYYAEKDATKPGVRGREGTTQRLADLHGMSQAAIRKSASRSIEVIKRCVENKIKQGTSR